MKDFFADRRPHEGLTYDAFQEQWRVAIDAPAPQGLSKDGRRTRHYVEYNWARSETVHARHEPSEALRDAVGQIQGPQLWMVLTEHWCGDSAYVLPVIVHAAGLSEQVTLRILPRDENLDIMDQYLTDTSRSIPKLVAFGEDGAERFQWGPRPTAAARLFADLKAEGKEKEAIVQELLAWYDDEGWRQADRELAQAVRTAQAAA